MVAAVVRAEAVRARAEAVRARAEAARARVVAARARVVAARARVVVAARAAVAAVVARAATAGTVAAVVARAATAAGTVAMVTVGVAPAVLPTGRLVGRLVLMAARAWRRTSRVLRQPRGRGGQRGKSACARPQDLTEATLPPRADARRLSTIGSRMW